MSTEQLTIERVDREWEVHDRDGDLVGLFGTRLGAVRFAECFTVDVVVLDTDTTS